EVTFRVTFSDDDNNPGFDDIVNFARSDLRLVTTGSIAGASITAVASNSNAVDAAHRAFDVRVNTGSGNGTIQLQFADPDFSVSDRAGNVGIANFTDGDVVTIDRTLGNPIISTFDQTLPSGSPLPVSLGNFTASATLSQSFFADYNHDGVLDLAVVL